jgi:hypothetical protein
MSEPITGRGRIYVKAGLRSRVDACHNFETSRRAKRTRRAASGPVQGRALRQFVVQVDNVALVGA